MTKDVLPLSSLLAVDGEVSYATVETTERLVVTRATTSDVHPQRVVEVRSAYSGKVPFVWSLRDTNLVNLCNADLVRDLLVALLDSREFIGHQLGHASGVLDDETFDKIADEFFDSVGSESDGQLLPRAALLHDLLMERLDTDVAAAALRCDVEQAERVLLHLAKLIDEHGMPLASALALTDVITRMK